MPYGTYVGALPKGAQALRNKARGGLMSIIRGSRRPLIPQSGMSLPFSLASSLKFSFQNHLQNFLSAVSGTMTRVVVFVLLGSLVLGTVQPVFAEIVVPAPPENSTATPVAPTVVPPPASLMAPNLGEALPNASEKSIEIPTAQDVTPSSDDINVSPLASPDAATADAKKSPKDGDDTSLQTLASSASTPPALNRTNTTQNMPRVDPATGALAFSYPIDVPPGRGAATPELSFNYSSQNTENFNPYGRGWSLSIP